jgi:hypothetical protein
MKKIFYLFLAVIFTAGCSHSYVFKSGDPIGTLNDNRPSQVPQKNSFNYVEYSLTSSSRYPMVRTMDPRRIARSQDVNSADQVPASSWFTPRLGFKSLSAQDLLKGPEEIGAPQPPFKVTKTKTKGNSPGFHVTDSRGKKYLFKFDSGDYPALESAVNLVVNRLFWGFGYNVPEDYLYVLDSADISLAEGSGVTQDDVDKVLTFSAIEDDGRYRVTASLFLEGELLGPIPQRGTRRGDINDRIPHENLRILRALRTFSAFTGNSGFRSDNSMDVYVGEPGKGHTVHYILDFGEALGVHGVEKNRPWDGYEHFFSYNAMIRNFLGFGLPIKGWENLETTLTDPKGTFNAENFDPKTWRESVQFMPMRQAQPEDDYWAAKILAALTQDHLETLFEAAKYPDPEYSKVMIQFLMQRRQKIFEYIFKQVSPLESEGFKDGALKVQDIAWKILNEEGTTRYEVKLFNQGIKKAAKTFWVEASDDAFEVKISPEIFQKARGYVRAEIRKEKSKRAAEFHLRSESGTPLLAGVVH